jgi:hypothetical protein
VERSTISRGIPSPAALAYRGGAMPNFVITEFYEVRRCKLAGGSHHAIL